VLRKLFLKAPHQPRSLTTHSWEHDGKRAAATDSLSTLIEPLCSSTIFLVSGGETQRGDLLFS
jgi:hypothetical protein